jgi:hypothetical protein
VVSASELKEVPGVLNRYVSKDGLVFKLNRDKVSFTELTVREQATTVGTYKTVGVYLVEEDAFRATYGVHCLVCLTFHGKPPNNGKRYEVNHKDGNKHNNHADNLEWSTRSENTLHALQSGLRKDNIPLTIVNVLTGEETTYYAIIEASRKLNIPRATIYKLMAKHQKIPYEAKWLFKFDKERFGLVIRKNVGSIHAKCYKTGKIFIGDSANEMSLFLGISANQVMTTKRNFPNGRLVSHFFVRDSSIVDPWPEFTEEEIQNSVNKEQHRPPPTPPQPIVVKNMLTGEVNEYDSCNSFGVTIGIRSSEITSDLKHGGNRLFKGYCVKLKEGFKEWPEFSMLQIKLSAMGKRQDLKPFEVTDLLANTTKVYFNVIDFMQEIGKVYPKYSLEMFFSRPDVRDKYSFKYLSDI